VSALSAITDAAAPRSPLRIPVPVPWVCEKGILPDQQVYVRV
jgi:hypothetical protein